MAQTNQQSPSSGGTGSSGGRGGDTTGRSDTGGRAMTRGGELRGGLMRGGMTSPFMLMRRMFEDMDRMFSDFGGGLSTLGGLGRGLERQMDWIPQMEVFERDNQYVVRCDLPGMKKDDVRLELREGMLSIEGERRSENEESREGFFHSERSYGSFRRMVQLPEGVDESSVKATFRDGVLEVAMKKAAQGNRGRTIEISEGGAGPMKH